MHRPIVLSIAFALSAAACSGVADQVASPQELTTVPTLESSTSTSELDLILGEDRKAPPGLSYRPADSTVPTVSTPAGGGSQGPATTTAAPSGGSSNGYSGVLGTYGPTDVLATTSAPFPQTQPGTAPLTGLAYSGPSRPAVVVKIDNSSKGRPQQGLNQADVIIEEEVEWGITRLAAVFHSNNSTVGPVRSGRTTDISFINSLGGAALVYSGANRIFDDMLLAQPGVQNFSAARSSGFWRQSGRRAPSNLFAETTSFNQSGSNPPAWFSYGPAFAGTPTSSLNVTLGDTRVAWQWDGSSWLRNQNGSAHNTVDGGQVSAANVVVAEVASFHTGFSDSAGGPIPEYVWAGSGPVTVFSNGQRIEGTWIRPRLVDPAVLVANDGTVINLTPGRTWVELVEPNVLTSS